MVETITVSADYKVTANITNEVKCRAFDKLLDFYIEHEVFSSESLLQMDDPIIEAPHLLALIADDIIKFKQEWK